MYGGTHVTERCHTNQASDSESDLKSYRRSKGETIIYYMISNVENEDAYLHYFKQLISFEEGLNKQVGSDILDIEHFNYNQNTRKGKVKRSNTNLRNETASFANSKHMRQESLELRVNFVGKQVDRIAMRRDILENVYDQDNDDELYDEFLDQLIVLEESFIENTS